MNNKMVIIFKAIFAGFVIGLAGVIYLNLTPDYNVLGALLFSFGLLVVCSFSLNLYTGKIGYIVEEKKGYFLKILLILLGNIVGMLFISLLVFIINNQTILDRAQLITSAKLDNAWYVTLVLSILCGMMMHLGVDGFKRAKNEIAKVFIVIGAVMIFILSKFEHSIANILYFSLAKWEFKTLLYFGIMVTGNAIGGMLICFISNIISKYEKKDEEKTNQSVENSNIDKK